MHPFVEVKVANNLHLKSPKALFMIKAVKVSDYGAYCFYSQLSATTAYVVFFAQFYCDCPYHTYPA